MEEFKKQGLHIKYKKEIEEWFIYLDQVEFGGLMEKYPELSTANILLGYA